MNMCYQVSAYLMATQLAGQLYAAASTAHGGDGHECLGGDCFGCADCAALQPRRRCLVLQFDRRHVACSGFVQDSCIGPEMPEPIEIAASDPCRPAFLVAACLAGFATLLAGIIAWRTRGVYRKSAPDTDPERQRAGRATADSLNYQS